MEGLKQSVSDLKDHVGEYAKAYADLAKVKATKAASNAASGMVVGVAAFILGFLFLIIVSVGLSLLVAGWVNSFAGGFFIVAGFYLLLIIIIVAMRKKVIFPMISNAIISKVYAKTN